jgi:hypothetical protein
MPKTYSEKPVDKWSVNDFLSYISDRHYQLYGVEYRPGRSWAAERGLIGGLIGTRQKPRKYEPALVKAFIDECFRTHRVSREYPGVSFTWFWTYKTAVWQRVLADAKRKQAVQQAVEQDEFDDDWL